MTPSVRILPPSSNPMAVAHAIADEAFVEDGVLTLKHWRGSFYRWNRTHWTEMEGRAVRSRLYQFTEAAVYLNEKGELVEWEPNKAKVGNLIEALAAICHLPEHVQPPAWIDDMERPSATEFIAVNNGLLRIGTRELLEHTPQLFNVVGVPFDFDSDAPPPERWLGFLDQLWPDDPESVVALAEWFGYVLSGRTNLHKILLLVGPMRSGKGTIARVLTGLVGRGNTTGPTLASLGQNFGLQDVFGKTLAIISDARLGGSNSHTVVERLLAISGEDGLTIDRKYRDPWFGQLPTRFFVISNELPSFGDASGAIASRFIVLILRQSWLGHEDIDLTAKLLSELPGILNWSLDGLEGLEEQGRFTVPQASRDAEVALSDLASPISAFIRDRCEVGPLLEAPASHLYALWKQWAEENGHRATSVQRFGRDLRAAVPGLRMIHVRDGDRRDRWYRGIGLPGHPKRRETEVRSDSRSDPTSPARKGTRSGPL